MSPGLSTHVIETKRLILRLLKKEDADAIFILRSDEAINTYVDRPRAVTVEDAKAFIEKIRQLSETGKTFYRALAIKETNELIGTITLWNFDQQSKKAEIGYELLNEFQGKGYMLEAIKAIIEFAFSYLQLSVIEGWTHPENTSSIKLLEKLGYKRDIEAETLKPADANEIIFSLKNGDHS